MDNAVKTGSIGDDLRVEVRGLVKSFRRASGDQVRAIDDVTVAVKPGEILVLLGPSGCGKSTLLRSIAGLEHPDEGQILIAGELVFDGGRRLNIPPNERDVNMMFQSYALWPHMTIEDNVGYPLRIAGESKAESRRVAREYLEIVGLAGLGSQYAGAISGGQQQRVALARTLISAPSVVLFDEPLSNVDAKVREQLRVELLRLHQELGFAAVYVTHDQVEAMGLGGRVAVMRSGQIDQIGDPMSIYERPSSRYTAEFIGDANFIYAQVVHVSATEIQVSSELGTLKMDVGIATAVQGMPDIGERVTLMIRPEYLAVDPGSAAVENSVAAVVEATLYGGAHTEYHCAAGSVKLRAWSFGANALLAAGTDVSILFPREGIRIVERSGR